MAARPTYAQLGEHGEAPAGSTWGLFGPDDQVGTLNLVGNREVLEAARCIRSGEVYALDYPLDEFDPPLAPTRHTPEHRIFSRHPDHRDDVIDSLYPQAGSQWDGLRHRRHHAYGFYNRTPDEAITTNSDTLGVSNWSERGIVARGILLDVTRSGGLDGRSLDHWSGEHIGVRELEQALDRQGASPTVGDVLLLHTGWADWFLELPPDDQAAVREHRRFTGVTQEREILAWLWNHGFAAVASDTFAFEALPAREDSPFMTETDAGMMHQELIALLGYAVGELWRLRPLAEACSADGRYTCMLTSKPLNVRGGVGSPCNALAIR